MCTSITNDAIACWGGDSWRADELVLMTTNGGAMLVLEIVAASWIALLCASESVYHPGTATTKSEAEVALSSLVVTHIMKFCKVHPSRYQLRGRKPLLLSKICSSLAQGRSTLNKRVAIR